MSRSGRVHDRNLLDTLETLGSEPFSGTVWRTTWATRDPLAGNNAGGRWHPANSFEALYTSLEFDGSLAEVHYHLSRAPVFSSSHVKIFSLHVTTQRTLNLTEQALTELDFDKKEFESSKYERSQEIGAAAYFLEFDSILVKSARSDYLNLILFLDQLDFSAINVEEEHEVNWPAWQRKNNNS